MASGRGLYRRFGITPTPGTTWLYSATDVASSRSEVTMAAGS